MKKHISTVCLLLLCLFLSKAAHSQTLVWLPKLPVAGGQLSVTYHAKGGDLEFSDQVNAEVAFYQDFKWQATNLPLVKTDQDWTATYQLPVNAVFIAFKFYQGTAGKIEASDNNNGKGYYTPIVSPKKKPAPGSYLAEALLTTPDMNIIVLKGYSIPVKNPGRIDSLLNKEAALRNSSIDAYLVDYLNLKRSTMDSETFKNFADQVLQKELKAKNTDEKTLETIHHYYAYNLKNTEQSKNVEAIIFNKYPHGNIARFLAYQNVNQQSDPVKYRVSAEQFLRDFPYEEWKQKSDGKEFIYYAVSRGLAANYFESQQFDKFIALFKDFNFKTANEAYRWNITKQEMLGRGDKKVLFVLSSAIIPYLVKRRTDGSYYQDFGGDVKKEQENANDQLDDRLFTHISLAYAIKNYQDALASYQFLSQKGLYGNADLNTMRMNMMKETGGTKFIPALLEASMKANAVTPAMFQEMKQIYTSQHNGSMEGYEHYLSKLMPEDKKVEMRAHVMANMVSYPLPPFTLESASGNFVSSSEWKKQIVVIDFWATWCRPCISAFPGMQLLIDQYAKDTQVAVYMIGTMQNGDYKTKSVNYVKSQGYRFNLLHDAVGANGEQSEVFRSLVPLFKSSGIPRKIIVKNGEVRYSSEGYGGSPSELKDELSMAIEILRAEK